MSKTVDLNQPDAKRMKLESSDQKASNSVSLAAVAEGGDNNVQTDGVSLQQTSTRSSDSGATGGETTTATKKDFSGFSKEPTLEQIRQLHENFCKERNWGQYHTPRSILLALVGEVGETAELFQWKEDVKAGLPGWTDRERSDVADELSDVLIYLVRLADRCHVDLPTAVLHKMEKNAKKYPVASVYGSSKKYTEYQDST